MKGRRPKSEAEKALTGNAGRRKPKPKPEGQPPEKSPENFFSSADPWAPPAWLTEAATRVWNREVPDILRLTKVQDTARPIIASYCQALADLETYSKHISEHGPVVQTPSGFQRKSPYVELRDKARSEVTKLANELNLTPKSWISSMGTFTGQQLDMFHQRGPASSPPPKPQDAAAPASAATPTHGLSSFIGNRPTIN